MDDNHLTPAASVKSLLSIDAFLSNRPWEGLPPEFPSKGVPRYFGGIVGGENPSRYSKSPGLWNAFFNGMKVDGFFTAFDLPNPEKFPAFAESVFEIPGFIDLTVTNPYKSVAYEGLKEFSKHIHIEERVRRLGCLNHIIMDPERRRGWADNTDGQGLIRALKKRSRIDGAQVLLVGAGGAAAAIGYELVDEGAELLIVNIVEEDAASLAAKLMPYRRKNRTISSSSWSALPRACRSAAIIISAITSSTPLEPAAIERLQADCLCVDIRYGKSAAFAEAVRRTGRFCVDGREMLFGQFAFAAGRVAELCGFSSASASQVLSGIEESDWSGNGENP